MPDSPVAVVVITGNRRAELLRTLALLVGLPDATEVVVDNACGDGTPVSLAMDFPQVRLVALRESVGAVRRTVGVRATSGRRCI